MAIVFLFVIFYAVTSIWDVVHVNGIVGKMVDPGAYRRAHQAAPAQPAPRLVIPGQMANPPTA